MDTAYAAVIRRYFDAWNSGDGAAFDALLHPDYVNRSASPGLDTSRAGLPTIVGLMRAAFPDLTYTIEDLVIGADRVAVRCRVTGTHSGDFFGLAPTGRRFDVQQIQIERFQDGRIVEHWRLTDEALLMRQLTQ